MDGRLRPRRDFAPLEARRMEAARLFTRGHPQAEIVRRLKVSRPTAHRWYRAWPRHGRAGCKPRLDAAARERLEAARLKGPVAWGFPTPLWTLQWVTRVIWKTCHLRHHRRHVWRVLRALGWSRQRPARRAQECDEAVIARWVRVRWPQAKRKPPAGGLAGVSGRERVPCSAPLSGPLGPPKARRPA